jgi:hypothetical protein
MMRAVASLICGYVFGWGLFISGMMRPDKVLNFLDVLAIPSGGWDPSLAVVMAAALAVTGIGYALARRRPPVFAEKSQWPTQSAIDRAWSGCARDRPLPTWRHCRRPSSCSLLRWLSVRWPMISGTPGASLATLRR